MRPTAKVSFDNLREMRAAATTADQTAPYCAPYRSSTRVCICVCVICESVRVCMRVCCKALHACICRIKVAAKNNIAILPTGQAGVGRCETVKKRRRRETERRRWRERERKKDKLGVREREEERGSARDWETERVRNYALAVVKLNFMAVRLHFTPPSPPSLSLFPLRLLPFDWFIRVWKSSQPALPCPAVPWLPAARKANARLSYNCIWFSNVLPPSLSPWPSRSTLGSLEVPPVVCPDLSRIRPIGPVQKGGRLKLTTIEMLCCFGLNNYALSFMADL